MACMGVIRSQSKAYLLSDQKSVLAPAKRLTGGFNGAFFISILFSVELTSLTRPHRCSLECARFYVVAVTVCIQTGFGQALAIPPLSPARFGRGGALACALVRYQSV